MHKCNFIKYIVLICDLLYCDSFCIAALMFINVIIILPSNEARVRVALSACYVTLLVRSIGGTYGQIDGRFRSTYENSYRSACRLLLIAGLQGTPIYGTCVTRSRRSIGHDVARAQNVFDRLVVPAQPRCRLVMVV